MLFDEASSVIVCLDGMTVPPASETKFGKSPWWGYEADPWSYIHSSRLRAFKLSL